MGVIGEMSEQQHLSTESLQGYAEGAIGETDRAVLEAHLTACSRCTAELQEWHTLFATLAELPQLSPATGFANRVLDKVTIPAAMPVWAHWWASARQLAQRAVPLARRLTPRTAGAWAVAAAFVVLPLLLGGGVVTWLVSKDYITAQSLWLFVTERTASSMQSLGASALTTLLETNVSAWLVQQARSLAVAAGMRGLGVMAGGLGGMTMLSIWVLYRNLFRTPTREANHVS